MNLKTVHPSVPRMWLEFLGSQPPSRELDLPFSSWHFCDNEHDADECAELTKNGRKCATAPSLWALHHTGEQLPRVGDLHVITNWAGIAQCVIQITSVEIVPLDAINESHALAEGEGDCSLAWWRKVHWDYYHRELEGTGYVPQLTMPIVFQRFKCVFR